MKKYMFTIYWDRNNDYNIFDGDSPEDKKMLKSVYDWISGLFDGTLIDNFLSEDKEDALCSFDLRCYEVEQKKIGKEIDGKNKIYLMR